MKIQVFDSDGVFRGGLLKTERLANCRTWNGPPHPHYAEIMSDISGHGEPSYEGSWFLLQMSKIPQISGSRNRDIEFDGDSHAIRVTSREAMRWFKDKVYETPPDLIELAKAFKGGDAKYDGDGPNDGGHKPMTELQQKIWDLLDGKAMLGKELAKICYGNPKRATAIRKHIEAIKRTGRTINVKRTVGYFRSDAPPPGLEASVSAPELTVRQQKSQAE